DYIFFIILFFFFQAEDGIRDGHVTGVQTCALPICTEGKVNFNPFGSTITWVPTVKVAKRAMTNASPRSPAVTTPAGETRAEVSRSEERRVGKECRSRRGEAHEKKREEEKRASQWEK